MKWKGLAAILALTSLAVLTLPIYLAAQGNKAEEPKHHHYKLIDIGTFGGRQSYVNPGSGNESGNYAVVLNSAGVVTGNADTSTPDPFPTFCFNEDCFVSHTFVLKDGSKTDLGALPGGASSAGNWITANGLIAGFSQNGEIDPLIPGLPEVHAALWRNGGITDLGTLPEGGFESIASAVNSQGQAVGLALNTIPDPNSMVALFQTRAFLWQNGAMQDLGTLGGTDAQAILINERGQVVGWSYVNSVPINNDTCLPGFTFVTGSFIWDKENGMRDLGSLGGTCTTASDMNNRGQVVGFSNLPGDVIAHGFLWDNGEFQDLGGSLGGNSQGPFAVNERGESVGFAHLPGDSIFHAVLWKRVGEMIDLGGAGNDQCSYATSINSREQVIGTFAHCLATGHVFLWESGSMVDLNALIPPNTPLLLEFAETINDRGEIAGQAFDDNGNQHAFLAIPCDENHPDLEGCDYSLVEASTVGSEGKQATAKPTLSPQAIKQPMRSFGPRSSPWAWSFLRNPRQAVLSSPAVVLSPIASLSPTSLTFSVQALGVTSPATIVTMKNAGTNNLTISSIAITGTNAGDFAQTHTCAGSLAVGTSCGISVTFKPTASGTRTAALSITDNASGSPQQVPLNGTGTTAKLSPTSRNFGTMAIGTTSRVESVTLTNVGTTTLTITGIAITGTNATDFLQTDTCGSSMPAGTSCSISVTFKPTASGARTAALSVSDNAAGSPQKVSLNGTGTTAKLIPSGLIYFGFVQIGKTSTRTVTLTNVGTTTLTITAITITGDAADFLQTHTCGSSLAAGASCSISVTFKPTQSGIGIRNATLSVADNASGSPQTVPLAGGCIPFGGFCYGPGPNMCCPAPYPHHSFCSDPTGWGTCIES